MNSLTRIMSYDKTKVNQENCISSENVKLENQINYYPSLSEEEIERIILERYLDKDEKTKTFIRKALQKHGDRYDYSKVNYIKSNEKVEIICRVAEHKSFWQTPSHHLHGRGCCICSGRKKSNVEEFVKRAKEIHGDKYDYSKVEYINNRTKIIIICSKHGEFKQTPYSHLNTTGCPICNGRLMNNESFIEKANKIHGIGTYDYSKSDYINSITPIEIICQKHGSFWQTPHKHLSGEGCPFCGIKNRADKQKLSTDEFIKKANEIHGIGTYDYCKVNYINSQTKVEIICQKHGSFWQTPNSHLCGQGCPKCSGNYNQTTEGFIEKAKEIHGDKYDYSLVKYKDLKTKVTIVCPKHKKFLQKPLVHLLGCGCPKCNASKGEIMVRNYLIKHEFEFEEQKRFNDCRNKRPLPFDFYIPKYNLCIEFDGQLHYMSVKYFGGDEKLNERKNNDLIKNNYCKEKGINLLRIRYDENVEEKLTEYFQEHEIIQESTIF